VDVGGTTYVTRTTSNGATTLESRAEVKSGVARFECIRSASGHCHYTVMPAECARTRVRAPWPVDPCPAQDVRRFALVAGDARSVAGLSAFRLCVDTLADGTCAAEPGADDATGVALR
jgi:hypothetical protein